MAFTTYLYYFAGGYAALVVALYMLSFVSHKAGFAARLLASYVSLVAAASFGVFASIGLRVLGEEGSGQWLAGRFFKLVMMATTGVTFEVVDPAGHLGKVRPAVFLGNHQTELDVLMLGCLFPRHCSVTAKSSLRRTPVLGWFMSLSGAIFIDRKNSRDARDTMKGAAEEIRKRQQCVYMFPEGTRSYAREPMLLPFKKGAFHLAVQAQVPIVPCVVTNYSHVLWIKGFVFRSGKIPVKVLEPIPTTGMTSADVDELTTLTYDRMLKELIVLTAQARGEPITIPSNIESNGVIKASGVDVKASSSSP